jgi:hypothetical protein
MQPYACVLVREQADRERIADAMLASNAVKVKQAPVVAVFAADLGASSASCVGCIGWWRLTVRCAMPVNRTQPPRAAHPKAHAR